MQRRALLRGLALGPWMTMACGDTTPLLRFSGIPDGDKRALKEGYAVVARYLTRALGQRVEAMHVPDYTAAVVSLATSGIDFAWLGGVTTVQAEQRTPGGIHFVAARERDLHFKSYVIANAAVARNRGLVPVATRDPQSLDQLATLAPAMRGTKFSFGAKNSTSGHIMPRAFFSDAKVGIDPRAHFDGGPTYQRKGGHAATLRAVASGAVDFGVLNFATWEQADEGLRTSAPVVAVTPEFVDYCLVARGSMAREQVDALRRALVTLDGTDAEHRAVLDAFSARRFVSVDPSSWDGIRNVLSQLETSGILE